MKNGEQSISLEEVKDKLDTKYLKEKRRQTPLIVII